MSLNIDQVQSQYGDFNNYSVDNSNRIYIENLTSEK